MKKIINKLNNVNLGSSSEESFDEAEGKNSGKLMPPVSAFNFNQEADDRVAASLPSARKLLAVAAAVFVAAASFAFLSKSALSSLNSDLEAEQSAAMRVTQQITALVGGGRELPDHVQRRDADIKTASAGSTDVAALWTAVNETLPDGVVVESMNVTPNTETSGARDVALAVIVENGVQIVEWENALRASQAFSLTTGGVSDEAAPRVTAVVTVSGDLFARATQDISTEDEKEGPSDEK